MSNMSMWMSGISIKSGFNVEHFDNMSDTPIDSILAQFDYKYFKGIRCRVFR
jgi:hypothetical protein